MLYNNPFVFNALRQSFRVQCSMTVLSWSMLYTSPFVFNALLQSFRVQCSMTVPSCSMLYDSPFVFAPHRMAMYNDMALPITKFRFFLRTTKTKTHFDHWLFSELTSIVCAVFPRWKNPTVTLSCCGSRRGLTVLCCLLSRARPLLISLRVAPSKGR